MNGLEQYSDAEILQAAGIGEGGAPPPATNLSAYSDEEILKAAGIGKPVPATATPPIAPIPEPPQHTTNLLASTGKVAIAAGGGILALPVAAIASLTQLIRGKGAHSAVEAADYIASLPNKAVTTVEEKRALELLGWPFEKAGAGWKGLVELVSSGSLQEAADVVEGKKPGSNILVPIAGVLGETSAMLASPGKVKEITKARAAVRDAAREYYPKVAKEQIEAIQKRITSQAEADSLIQKFQRRTGTLPIELMSDAEVMKAAGITSPLSYEEQGKMGPGAPPLETGWPKEARLVTEDLSKFEAREPGAKTTFAPAPERPAVWYDKEGHPVDETGKRITLPKQAPPVTEVGKEPKILEKDVDRLEDLKTEAFQKDGRFGAFFPGWPQGEPIRIAGEPIEQPPTGYMGPRTSELPPEPSPPPTGEGGGAARGEISPAPPERGGVPTATPTPKPMMDEELYQQWLAEEPLTPAAAAKLRQETADAILNKEMAKKRPIGTMAIMLDDGTKLMRKGAETPEEVAIANQIGPSRIAKVGVVTDQGKWIFDKGKYKAKTSEAMLDELSDLTKGKGRKGIMAAAMDILGTERGSFSLKGKTPDKAWVDPDGRVIDKDTGPMKPITTAMNRMIDFAKRTGKPLEETMRALKFNDEDIATTLQYLRQEKDIAATKAVAKGEPSPLFPDSIDVGRSMQEAAPKLEVMNNAMRSEILKTKGMKLGPGAGVQHYFQWLQDTKRVVAPYEKGSMVMPDRQIPLIKEEKPTAKRDISRRHMAWSPHRWQGFAFGIEDMPVSDFSESNMTYAANTKSYLRWWKDMAKEFNKSEQSKEIKRVMEAERDKYEVDMGPYWQLQNDLAHAKKEAKEAAKGSPVQQQYEADIPRIEQALEDMGPTISRIHSALWDTIYGLAKKYPTARAFLDAGGMLPKDVHTSAAEHTWAGTARGYLDPAAQVMFNQGIPMRGVGKYIPFGSDLLKDVSGKEVTGVHRVPEILKYMEREGNIPWLPDLDAVMKSYIPIAEFKMAHQPALNRWKPFIDTTRQQGLKNGLNRWLEENFYKRPPGAWQQLLNGVVNFEYLRLLSLNGPPGFKHIMKELGTLSEYGPVDMSKGVALAAKAPIQLAKEKLGLKGKNAELNLIRAYVNLRNIVRVGDEMPGFNAAMTRTKAIFGNPITTVELADNGVSVLSTISAGYKRGVDPLTIHYKMWNTLMSVNFRGFLDQPLFQKIPTVRGLTMFMMTPLKLAEYKLDLAKNAAKDIYSTVRGQGGVKDAFGTHWTTKAMRMLVAIGLGEAIAQHYFNTSIIHITAGHWGPFSNLVEGKKEGFPIGIGDIQIQSESPVVQAASRMHKDFFTPQGQKKFWLSELKSPTASRIWNIKESSIPEDVTVGPYTIPVHDIAKWMGVKKGKMPKQYESPAKYELGLPKLGTSYRKAKSSLGSLH